MFAVESMLTLLLLLLLEETLSDICKLSTCVLQSDWSDMLHRYDTNTLYIVLTKIINVYVN